ncbi:hypothetical protein [Streptomyces sp. IBSBF 2390]|uniref:hypothetical protein n=1 Tax=Streptomyces sp. IBSBF 2390 TaxID=2903533 RepID=UPI002FDC1B5B
MSDGDQVSKEVWVLHWRLGGCVEQLLTDAGLQGEGTIQVLGAHRRWVATCLIEAGSATAIAVG